MRSLEGVELFEEIVRTFDLYGEVAGSSHQGPIVRNDQILSAETKIRTAGAEDRLRAARTYPDSPSLRALPSSLHLERCDRVLDTVTFDPEALEVESDDLTDKHRLCCIELISYRTTINTTACRSLRCSDRRKHPYDDESKSDSHGAPSCVCLTATASAARTAMRWMAQLTTQERSGLRRRQPELTG